MAPTSRRSPFFSGSDGLDLRALRHVAAGAGDDLLAPDQTFDEIDIATVVETAYHRDEVNPPRVVHRRNVDTARVGDDSTRRDADDAMGHGDHDRDLRVHAAEEVALRVGDVDLDVERAKRGIEGTRGTGHVALEHAARNLPDGDVGRLAVLDARSKGLRHLYEHADRIDRFDPETVAGCPPRRPR